jgi:hypothetical protein
MLSMAQFGRGMAEDRIERLIDEANSATNGGSRRKPLSAWLARSQRGMADRIDSPRPRPMTDPSRGPC